MTIQITVPGPPRGKKSVSGGRYGRYVHPKSKEYMRLVAQCAMVAMAGKKRIEGPVKMIRVAYIETPKSWSKKKRDAANRGEVWPARWPDEDNVAKSINDGLNGIVYNDDKQVVDGQTVKFYSEKPRVEVFVSEIGVGDTPSKHLLFNGG